ncbi:MAG TPA: hypothetical protein VOA80_01790 [Thermoanaerobaculia bacterium]|nr:hypothetical protein [Thermoanaerobaculia bacterium]
MTTVGMPFVAIIGGFWQFKNDPAVFGEAKKTASEIGAALANAGMGLVVYFSNDESLEPHVVSGYVKALPVGGGRKCIRVRFAESQKGTVKFAEQLTRSELFELSLFAGHEWEAPFYRSLVATDGVDAVLLMAGARSTLIAGQIALARPLPILAVDKFDGAAGTVRSELAIGERDYPSAATHSAAELVAWLKVKLVARAEEQALARLREQKYLQATSQKRKTLCAVGAFAALLCTVFFGVAVVPTPAFYPFLTLTGLIAAGATGALVRSLIWGSEDTPPTRSLFLGGVAGFVVGLAYLVPQWVGAPGVLAPSATTVGATDKIQFVSAVLVAVSAGVGFDTVFTRLKKQAEDQPIGASGSK